MPGHYYWHESSTGQMHGPEVKEAIARAVRTGQIRLSDFLAPAGTQAWTPLAQSEFAGHSEDLSNLLAALEFGPNEEKRKLLGQVREFHVPLDCVRDLFLKINNRELVSSEIRFVVAATLAALGYRSQQTVDDVISCLSVKCFAEGKSVSYFPWLREVDDLLPHLRAFVPATRVAAIEALSFFKEKEQVSNILAGILSDESSRNWRPFILYAIAAQADPRNIGYLKYYGERGVSAAAIGLEHFSKASLIEMLRIGAARPKEQ